MAGLLMIDIAKKKPMSAAGMDHDGYKENGDSGDDMIDKGFMKAVSKFRSAGSDDEAAKYLKHAIQICLEKYKDDEDY